MKRKESAPTFEEFKDAVAERLVPMIAAIRETEDAMTAREYVDSEEGDSILREHYELNLERFNLGKLSRSIFLGDCVSSVVVCLSLTYEPIPMERKTSDN